MNAKNNTSLETRIPNSKKRPIAAVIQTKKVLGIKEMRSPSSEEFSFSGDEVDNGEVISEDGQIRDSVKLTQNTNTLSVLDKNFHRRQKYQ